MAREAIRAIHRHGNCEEQSLEQVYVDGEGE